MDPNYEAVMADMNRLLPEHYECIRIMPMRPNWVFDDEGNFHAGTDAEEVQLLNLAKFIGVVTAVKDEYREPWWNDIGGQPTHTLRCNPHLFESVAGVADVLVPQIVDELDNYIANYRPKTETEEPKPKTGARKKSKATANE